MRFLHYRQRRRALALTPYLVALTAICGLLSAPSFGQDLFVTSDATIAGGNPVNGDYDHVTVGQDAGGNSFMGVSADITGGNIAFTVAARNASLVNISGGTIGAKATDDFFPALSVSQGSTLNLSGGTIRSYADVGNFSNDGTLSTLNMSGGTIPYIFNGYGAITNITGGTVRSSIGWARGHVENTGDGTVNISGGTLDAVFAYGFDGNVTNFGGTATANNLEISTYYGNSVGNVTGGTIGAVAVSDNGVANISGGSIGAVGGVTILGGGVVNFTGSDFTVNQTGPSGYFSEANYANFIVTGYAVTGTLSDGAALSATVSGGDYSNNGTTLSFGGGALAPDLFVQTDQTVSGIYNNVSIGIDKTYTTKSSPTVTIADGTDTVYVNAYSGSVTNMTGGIVHAGFYAHDTSQANISGGEIRDALYAYGDNNVLNISGGSVANGVYAYGNSVVTVSGGVSDSGYSLGDKATLTFQGSDLSVSGTGGRYWDGNTNYSAFGEFTVTGTLADGTAVSRTVRGGGATGDTGKQTFFAGIAAPDLYLTEDGGVDTFNNVVTVGRSADGSLNTSPTVAINDGADVGRMKVYNESVLNILGGVVRGTIYTTPDTTVNIAGGEVSRITPSGKLNVTGGDVAVLDTYAGARVRIDGGQITSILAYGYPSSRGDVAIFGGSIGSVIGHGGAVNIHGGSFGVDSLVNLGYFNIYPSPFQLYGVGLSITNGVAGTYQGYNGVWWDVTGTLQSGQPIDTRYFESNGSLNGPANIGITVAAPEPGALAFLLLGLPAFVALRRRKEIE